MRRGGNIPLRGPSAVHIDWQETGFLRGLWGLFSLEFLLHGFGDRSRHADALEPREFSNQRVGFGFLMLRLIFPTALTG